MLRQKGAVTVGDMHGNTLKLLNFLLRYNVITMNKEAFDSFVSPYRFGRSDSAPEAVKMQCDPNQAFRLIGDELCDRGKNDYITISLLQHLHEKHNNFSILCSNHGFEFMRYACASKATDPKISSDSFNNYKAYCKLIEIDPRTYAKSFCNDVYFKYLKLVDYEMVEGDHVIYAHAPVSIAMLLGVAEILGVDNFSSYCKKSDTSFLDNGHLNLATEINSFSQLPKLIEAINTEFLLFVRGEKQINEQDIFTMITGSKGSDHRQASVRRRQDKKSTLSPDTISRDNVLELILWNGDFSIYEHPNALPANVRFVHGHTKTPKAFKSDKVLNLDTSVGKSSNKLKGKVPIDRQRRELVCTTKKDYFDSILHSRWGLGVLVGLAVGLGVGFGTPFSFFATASTILFSLGGLAVSAGLVSSILLGLMTMAIVVTGLYCLDKASGYDYAPPDEPGKVDGPSYKSTRIDSFELEESNLGKPLSSDQEPYRQPKTT